jgi:gliding motility-associated-like protein
MTKKTLFLLLFFQISLAQSPAGIWYFGKKAGISFNSGTNPIALDNGQLETPEGCATLCDNSGNLLFYTDGIKVWNKNHLVMPNGNGLKGDPSSTQSAVIVPKPNFPNVFYVFTVDELGKPNGLNYSIIDLTLDNGLGDISSKNNQLATPCLEKITVVQHANGNDFWVIAHRYNSNQFTCYLLTASGVNPAIISSAGTSIGNDTQRTLGYMKSSPNGEFVACANSGIGSEMQLFKFNNLTGQLTLISTSSINSNYIGAYGLEFSSNSNLLYVSRIDFTNSISQVFQFNIASQDETTINLSKTLVGEYIFDEFNEGILGALQLAPNQKIYVARNNLPFLDVINSPNTIGVGCNYSAQAVNLGTNLSYFGLPSFITSFLDLTFTSSNYCFGSQTNFQIPAVENVNSIVWDFGDINSPNNTSNLEQPIHIYTAVGSYQVTLTMQIAGVFKVFHKQINIVNAPVANQPTNHFSCETAPSEAQFLLSTKNSEILLSQNASDYTISYHINAADATNNLNPLADNYTNIANPQTIYARIQATNGNDCFSITSFQLVTRLKPILEADSEHYYCIDTFPKKITLVSGNLSSNVGTTFLWSTNEITPNIQINESGNYQIKVTNSYNCSATRTITVIDSEIATINYTIIENNGNNSIVVNPIGIGSYLYALDNSNGNYQSSPIFENLTSGDHTIFVKDFHGCGIVSKAFSVFGYPNFFTPNNDGINDTWNFVGSFLNIKQVSIYDRFGKFIYTLKPNTIGWDGTINGSLYPADDYWFTVIFKDNKEIKGHFSLKR